MGQIADDMINGACCALCGQYFEKEHGHPVACEDCYEPDCGYEESTINLVE